MDKFFETKLIAEAQLRMLYASMGMSQATVDGAMARRARHPSDHKAPHPTKGKRRLTSKATGAAESKR